MVSFIVEGKQNTNTGKNNMTTTFQIPSDMCIEKINGKWFIETDSSSIDCELTFRNCGNGPELVNDNIHGPFADESDASKWLESYLADCD